MVTHTLSLLRVLTLTGALVAPFISGCAVPTVVGGDGNGDTAAGQNALAIRCAAGTGVPCDPGSTTGPMEVVIASGDTLTCADPSIPCTANAWQVSLVLQPAVQVPGTYSLSDPSINSLFMQVQGPAGGGCSGGGGGSLGGTLEIVSIDATSIEVTLSGLTLPDMGGSLPQVDGTYDAPFCK
jgi:hypothetical protein